MEKLASIKKQLTSFHLLCLQLHSSLRPSHPPSPSLLFPCPPGCYGSLAVAAAAAGCAAIRETVTTKRSIKKVIPRQRKTKTQTSPQIPT